MVTGWAWPLAVVWWATTAKSGCYSASHVYKYMAKHFQCFHSQANHCGVQIFLLHFGDQQWILLCFGKQLWICVCQIVGVICNTCIISILLCCYYNCKESRNACYISTKLQHRTHGLNILSPESPCGHEGHHILLLLVPNKGALFLDPEALALLWWLEVYYTAVPFVARSVDRSSYSESNLQIMCWQLQII